MLQSFGICVTMGGMKRDLLKIDDLPNGALLRLMELADELQADLRGNSNRLSGFLMGSLFLEPSTRTRLSFEAAMARLGGKVITSSDPGTSSSVKGETLADTVRIVDSYVDFTVLRHPLAGAARWAAQHAQRPIINAGDGAHEHPTQTLCDLYALKCERGDLAGLTVLLYGDLKFGRTVHSLSRALVRMGASVLAIAELGLELPSHVTQDLEHRDGVSLSHVVIDDMEEIFRRRGVRATWIGREDRIGPTSGTPEDPVELNLQAHPVDAIYVTRLQKERFVGDEGDRGLPILDHRFMKADPFEQAIVLHPLPRVEEIAPEMDQDPRAAYFRQAALGVPIRMALLLWVAGLEDLPMNGQESLWPRTSPATDRRCKNLRCITNSQREGVPQELAPGRRGPLRCRFCEEDA